MGYKYCYSITPRFAACWYMPKLVRLRVYTLGFTVMQQMRNQTTSSKNVQFCGNATVYDILSHATVTSNACLMLFHGNCVSSASQKCHLVLSSRTTCVDVIIYCLTFTSTDRASTYPPSTGMSELPHVRFGKSHLYRHSAKYGVIVKYGG